MTGIAITSTAIMTENLARARSGVLPAIVGALGAAIGLHALAPLFATASVPMSVLGVVLGIRSRNIEALGAGALAIVCALVALLNSDVSWVVFGAFAGAVGAA